MPISALDAAAHGLFDDDDAAQAPTGAGDAAAFGDEMATLQQGAGPRVLPMAPPGSPRVASHTLQGVGLAELEEEAGAQTRSEMPLHLSDLHMESVSPTSRTAGLPTLPTGISPLDPPATEAPQQHVLGTTLPPQPLTELQNAALQRSASGTDPMGLSGTAEVATQRVQRESTDEVPTTVKSAQQIASRGITRARPPTSEEAAAKTAPMQGLPSLLDSGGDPDMTQPPSPIEPRTGRPASSPTLPPSPEHEAGVATLAEKHAPTTPQPTVAAAKAAPAMGAPAKAAPAPAVAGNPGYEIDSPSRNLSNPGYREHQQTMSVMPAVPRRGTRLALIALWSLAIGAAITAVVLLLLK